MNCININKKIIYAVISVLISVCLLILSGCGFFEELLDVFLEPEIDLDGNFAAHFIDVGQGDCILIQTPENYFMLIDTGERDNHGKITEYLKRFKVSEFEYVIFTHPHADHIGSADLIVRDYKINTLIMPNIYHTTQTFERLVTEIENKNMQITMPVPGEVFKFGGAEFVILAPLSEEYKNNNLNNYSVSIKMTYKNTSFLFTGDMEKESEDEVMAYHGLNNPGLLSADVLDVAHHGSSSSTQQNFLELVNPSFAVISVGRDNRYNHPSLQTIGRLESVGARILRTDLDGDIIIVSDGDNLSVR